MAKQKNITAETILPLLEDGLPVTEISRQLEIKPASVVYWKKKLNLGDTPKRYDWTEIQEAHDNGATYDDLYELFGVVKRTIQRAKERGVFTPRERTRRTDDEIRACKREAWARYMVKKKNQTPEDEDLKALQEFYKNCPPGHEVDHILPISKGGQHTLSNLQYLTVSENRRKSNKII